jgi:protein gp37
VSKTSIEWTDATWNPTRGCSRVSEGCRNCYAERMALRFMGPGQPFEGFAKVIAPRDSLDRVGGRRNGWNGSVKLVPSKLDEPLRWRKPRRVFVNSMSDLFHEALSDVAIATVFGVMRETPEHTFQVLTKRAARMLTWTTGMHGAHFSLPLPNVWLGVSVEDQRTADERIPLLLQTPAAVRFISYEPALGPVDLRPYVALLDVLCCPRCGFRTNRKTELDCPNDGVALGPDVRLDWVIVGGESGPGARPFDLAWARSIVYQCREASVPVFVKQLGAQWARIGANHRQIGRHSAKRVSPKGGDPSEWPEDLRVREFPR